MPKRHVDINTIVGKKVMERIAAIVATTSDVGGLQSLCKTVTDQLINEFHVPTTEGVTNLRWMVSNYISTQRHPSEKASTTQSTSVPFENDVVVEIDVDNLIPLDLTVRQQTLSQATGFNPQEYAGWDNALQHKIMDIRHDEIVFQIKKLENMPLEQQKLEIERRKIDAILEQHKIDADLEQRRIEAQREQRKIEADLEHRKLELEQRKLDIEAVNSETQRLYARAKLERADHPDKHTKPHCGKKRTASDGDEWLQSHARKGWCNMRCLSSHVWSSRPDWCTETVQDVFGRLMAYKLPTGTRSRSRMCPESVNMPLVSLTYVDVTADVEAIARAFWTDTRGCATALAAPTTLEGTATLAAPHQLPPAELAVVGPHHRLPDGAFDFAAAVVDPLCLNETDRAVAIQTLDMRFVRIGAIAEDWRVLWPRRPTNPLIIPTWIDVKSDPIVPKLTAWIATGQAETVSPPEYPVPEDPRPIPDVPLTLHTMNPDVWPLLVAVPCLARACGALRSAYEKGHWPPITPADAPCAERIRQWQRLPEELTYKQIVDTLGWHGIEKDVLVVKAITEALMSHRKVATSVWYIHRGSQNLWRWVECGTEVRTAATFVARVRKGNGDLQWMAYNIINNQ
jgi:predicted GNAT family acetyltransferase